MKQITTIAYFIVLVIACTSPSKKQVSAIEQREKDIQKQEEKNDNKPIYYETEIIDLSQRGISSLPDSILKFHNLKSINLSNNNFESFPIELFELPLLEEINFSEGFLSPNQMFDSINNDHFLIRLYEKCNDSKMKIICSHFETFYINTNQERDLDTPNEFLNLIADYQPLLKCEISFVEGDAIYYQDTKVNLEIYELNNGVSVRNWDLFYSAGQRFTFDLLDISEPLEQNILNSKWFLDGNEGNTEMWQNQRKCRTTQQGEKIYSVSRGGC